MLGKIFFEIFSNDQKLVTALKYQKSQFLTVFKESAKSVRRYLNVFFMNSKGISDQNISVSVNLSLKGETLRLLMEMAEDMGASLDEVLSSIAEDSVIDLKRLQDDLGIIIIPEKCSTEDLINSLL